jgi:hypothetical protein
VLPASGKLFPEGTRNYLARWGSFPYSSEPNVHPGKVGSTLASEYPAVQTSKHIAAGNCHRPYDRMGVMAAYFIALTGGH